MTEAEIFKIFEKNENQELIDKIIKDLKTITIYIIDHKIPLEIKEKIIQNKIDENNIIKELNKIQLEDLAHLIIKLKNEELNKAIEKMNKYQIKEELKKINSSYYIHKKIYEKKLNDLNKIIKSKSEAERILINTKEPRIAQLILDTTNIEKIITKINQEDIYKWLTSNNISEEIKYKIVEIKHKQFVEATKKESKITLFYNYLLETSYIPSKIQEEIIKIKYDDINIELDQTSPVGKIKYGHLSQPLKKYIIENKINQQNIFSSLDSLLSYPQDFETIINLKKDILNDEIKKIKIEELIRNDKLNLQEKTIELIVHYSHDIIKEKLLEVNEKERNKFLEYAPKEIKKIILDIVGLKEDRENIIILLNKYSSKIVLENYENVKNKIELAQIDYQAFMQYGSNTTYYYNWFIKLIKIHNTEEFIKIKTYMFENYYKESNKIKQIKNFLELIYDYEELYPLLINLEKNKIKLNNDDINTMKIIMKRKDKPQTIEEFKNYRYEKYIKEITEEKSIYRKIEAIFKLIQVEEDINVETLKKIKKDNKNNNIQNQIDELINYTTIYEQLHDLNGDNEVEKIYDYIFKDFETMKKIQDIFLNYDEKIKQIYEKEINTNLTQIEKMEKYDEKELSKKYGGKVIDISKKNYILCAHVVGRTEKIAELVAGKATGENNFISLSAISYKGQKYYFDTTSKIILAYDRLPEGSFICSSTQNMGTNSIIKNNSLETRRIRKDQCGILELSAVKNQNSEILAYRENLKPCGIIIPQGRMPQQREIEIHNLYNLPFLLTQPENTTIENPEEVFINEEKLNPVKEESNTQIINDINNFKIQNKKTDIYTGREIAIFTDSHAMFEPTLAVLETLRKRGITEIYSLGDNIGLGPNPCEVIDLLEEYKVKSVSGNSEYYQTIGTENFTYFDKQKKANEEWTSEKLGSKYIEKIKLYPPSIDIFLGNKKIALCHFINDIRWDYINNNTWTYQTNFRKGINAKQFLYTNSKQSKEDIINKIIMQDNKCLIDSLSNPIFNGKTINSYDYIFQGHVHYEIEDKINNTNIYTLRACGMGWDNYQKLTARVYILKEKKDGTFDIEKVSPYYNKTNLICNIKSSSLPYKEKILNYLK